MSAIRRNLISICLLLSFASLAVAGFLLLRRFSVQPLDPQFTTQVQAKDNAKEQLPVELVLQDQRIDLPIIPAQMNNQEWQLTNRGVSLLQSAAQTGKDHGLILYGHNWRSLLGNLHQVKLGDKISLIYGDGNVEQYTIQSTMTVSPTRLDVLDLAQEDTLLLYTCTGFLDGERLVVLAHK